MDEEQSLKLRFKQDALRYYCDKDITDAEIAERIKAILSDEKRKRKSQDFFESKKEGLKISEEFFYSTKIFNK